MDLNSRSCSSEIMEGAPMSLKLLDITVREEAVVGRSPQLHPEIIDFCSITSAVVSLASEAVNP